jgi:hypothetical protein
MKSYEKSENKIMDLDMEAPVRIVSEFKYKK